MCGCENGCDSVPKPCSLRRDFVNIRRASAARCRPSVSAARCRPSVSAARCRPSGSAARCRPSGSAARCRPSGSAARCRPSASGVGEHRRALRKASFPPRCEAEIRRFRPFMTIYFWRFEPPDLTPEIAFSFSSRHYVIMRIFGEEKESYFWNLFLTIFEICDT